MSVPFPVRHVLALIATLAPISHLMASQVDPERISGQLVSEAVSGSWFDVSHDGEGWKIEILDDSSAVIYWFTYPPPGVSGEQAWIGGVGRIEGNQIIVDADESFITSGGVFADPDRSVTLSTWGSFTFTFNGPDSGTMDYTGPAEWGSGSFDIIRLTAVTAADESLQTNLGKGISGSWISDEFASEGWLIEVYDEKRANIYWFTYDEAGNQAWNTGVGILVANSILVLNPVDAFGTVFGDDFDPTDVIRQNWGSYIFTFDDCNNGVITYFNGKGLGTSQIVLKRLTFLDGAPCADFVRTKGEQKPTIGAVCTNPDDPTLLISFRDDGHNGLFFGDKTVDGLAESLDKILVGPVPGADGESDTVIDLAAAGIGRMTSVADVASGNMASVELDPASGEVVLTGLTREGGLQSIVTGNLSELFRGKPSRSAPTPSAVSGQSGRSGEVTVWSNQFKSAPARPRPQGSQASVEVAVNRCGAPVTNVAVNTLITSEESASVNILLAGRQSSDGVYSIPIPTAAASDGALPEDDQCSGFAQRAGDACDLFDRLEDRNFPLLCSNAAAGMVEGGANEQKLSQASEFFISCASALNSGKLACDSAGSQQAAGNSDREEYVCSDAVSADRRLGFNVQFRTTVRIPGSRIPELPFSDENTYPPGGPFPSYEFVLDGPASIDGFTTMPSNPDPRQGYTAVARVGCLPANTQVLMTITGSDGFSGTGSCTITGNGECALVIPGGGQSVVRDTIDVSVPGADREVQILF